MFRIDKDLKEFLQGGVAVVVGTGDNSGRPQIAWGWGPRVLDASTVEVFLDTERAEKTLANLEANGQIAVTFGDPVSYRSVQLKGTFKGSRPTTAPDIEWVNRHHDAFSATTALVGDPPETIRNLFLDDFVCVSFSVTRAFDQTPGPDAGKPL